MPTINNAIPAYYGIRDCRGWCAFLSQRRSKVLRYSCWANILVYLLFVGSAEFADESDVSSAVEAYVTAFNKHDAVAIGKMWLEKGVHIDRASGERTVGREQIQQEIESAFKANEDVRLAVDIENVRFISSAIAMIEGRTILSSSSFPPTLSQFSAILARTESGWRIDTIDESSIAPPSTPTDALRKLEWLVGKWVDDAEGVRVETTVSWSLNQTFLIRSFLVGTEEGEPRTGTQIIGWDARTKNLRSWAFHSDGSFGEGVWSQNGEDWLIKSSQTLADGRAASGTYVLKQMDQDTISLRLIGHEIEGQALPATDAIVSRRVTVSSNSSSLKEGGQ